MRNANWGIQRGEDLRVSCGSGSAIQMFQPPISNAESFRLEWTPEFLISRIHFAHTSTLRYFSNTIDHLWLFSDCNIILRIAPLAYKTSLVLEPLFQKTDRTQFPKYDLCEHYVFSAECAWGTLHYSAICYIQCMHRDCHRFEVLMLRQ